jgi:tRNA(Ile)-lysidine synthase TilS/MesJ
MKKVLGCMRRADKDFGLIKAGDRVCVGVSGGKDSLLLLHAMALYRKFCPEPFEVMGLTLSMGWDGLDTSGIEAMAAKLDVPYEVIPTQIGKVVFEERKEKNPCSLCANMRRGALNEAARARGCNKVALGHHREDVLETLLLSALYEGRLHTFHPKTYLSRADLTVIRPMVYVTEKYIIGKARELNLPIAHNPCPANGVTKRQEMKEMLAKLTDTVPDAPAKLLSALRNTQQYGLWDKGRE